MRSDVHLLRSDRLQETWQGAPNVFVAAGGVEGVIENAEQAVPGGMLGMADVGRCVVLLKHNRPTGPQERKHLRKYCLLGRSGQIDEHEPLVNEVVGLFRKTSPECVGVDHLHVRQSSLV